MTKKEELRKLKKELENNCISLEKFLMIYFGIFNDKIDKIKISHKEIKELIPELRSVSFESLLKDKRNLYIGNIVAVKDSYGNIAPYVCISLKDVKEINEFSCEQDSMRKNINAQQFDEDSNLYELITACKILKRDKRFCEYRKVHKLLSEKKDVKVKEYKRTKYNLRIEEKVKDEY